MHTAALINKTCVWLAEDGSAHISYNRNETTVRLTGVWRKQHAALAVDDLLHRCCILGEGRRHQAQARHHGIYGGNASHQPKTGVKVWNKERNVDEDTERGRKLACVSSLPHPAQLTLAVTSYEHMLAVSCSILHCVLPLRTQSNTSVNSGDTHTVYK